MQDGPHQVAERVDEHVSHGRTQAAAGLLRGRSTGTVAEVVRLLREEHAASVLEALPGELQLRVFGLLPATRQRVILERTDDDEAGRLLRSLAPDDLTSLLGDLPGDLRERLLGLLRPDERRHVLELLEHPPESVGRLMTPEYVVLRPEWPLREALDHIRRRGRDSETLHTIFVVDEAGRLIDDIRLRSLILADPEARVEDIMDHRFHRLHVGADREEAVEAMQRYDVFVLPVVDDEGLLRGVVTADDVLDVQAQETTEDFHKGAAVQYITAGYRDATARSLFRARIPWLLVLVGVGLASATVIDAFERTLDAMLVLAIFIPLLIGSGGNTGAQAATIIVRAMSTGDVRRGEAMQALRKELLVGVGLGLAMAAAVAVLGFWFGGPDVAVIVAVAMFAIVLMANLLGVVMPVVFTRLGRDPAMASSPLIATLVDVLGLLVYFGIATWFLGRVA